MSVYNLGVETTVNLRDIAQHPDTVDIDIVPDVETDDMNFQGPVNEPSHVDQSKQSVMPREPVMGDMSVTEDTSSTETTNLRRSTRVSRPPKRFDDYVMK